MKNITMSKLASHAFGYFYEELAATTVFVLTDDNEVYVNPEILEEDDEIVVFKSSNFYGSDIEQMGTAVTLATCTPAEALKIAKAKGYRVVIENRLFEWSRGTRRNPTRWCAGFVKNRGSRVHLIPASMDDCVALVEGTKKITYWTNSRRCEIVAA